MIGIIDEGNGIGAGALESLNVPLEPLKAALEQLPQGLSRQ